MAEFKPVPLEKWGGLNLRDDEAEVALNGAVDLLNVDFDRRGRVRTRDGYASFVAAGGSVTGIPHLHPYNLADGTKQLLFGGTGAVLANAVTRAVSTAGATVATQAAYAATQFVNWSAPGSTVAYAVTDLVASQAFVPRLLKWTGSAFSFVGVSAAGAWTAIAVQPNDNRLVIGGREEYSEVRFSDAGDPETWSADNFVNLTPGDGETITAMVTWRDLLFVFKRSKFFVFYGNSTDGTGGSIFNYRTVATGRGSIGLQTVCAAPDGVYFVDRSGIYRTTGGVPELVSAEMAPLFDRNAGEFFTGSELVASDDVDASALHWHRDRLYLSFPTTGTTPSHTLVYDLRTGTWSLWDLAAAAFASWDTSAALTSASSLFFTSGATAYELSPSYTTDNGTAITSRYRTGFFSPAGATVPSTIREVLLEGTGTVDVKRSFDYGDLGTATSVSLGSSPAIAQSRAVAANNGRFHSYEFSSETGPWALNRATFMVESKGTVGKQP